MSPVTNVYCVAEYRGRAVLVVALSGMRIADDGGPSDTSESIGQQTLQSG